MTTAAASAPSTGPDVPVTHLAHGAWCGCKPSAPELGSLLMTDVTGFGLLGHLPGLAWESGLAAELDAAAVPALEGVEEWVGEDAVSGGTRGNRDDACAEVWSGHGAGAPRGLQSRQSRAARG